LNLKINLKVILLVSLIIRRNKRKKIVTKNNNDPNHLKPVDLDPLETENLLSYKTQGGLEQDQVKS
jgi:hypothetical protein